MTAPRPTVGDRVVVRFRLGEGAPADWRSSPNPPLEGAPSQSDITGILRSSDDDAITVERDGLHRIAVDAVVSVRLLSRRVVRNFEIREIERTLTLATTAVDRTETDGWLCTGAGDGPRAATASPIDFGASPLGALPALDWLADRGLPRRIWMADRLIRVPSLPVDVVAQEQFEVLVGPAETGDADCVTIADGVAAVTVRVDDGPDDVRRAWRDRGFELHHTCRLLGLRP